MKLKLLYKRSMALFCLQVLLENSSLYRLNLIIDLMVWIIKLDYLQSNLEFWDRLEGEWDDLIR